MTNEWKRTLAIFYCQNVPGSSNQDRQSLEKRYGSNIRLFPIACSGRLEPLHLLKALEEFADAAYVVTCPVGTCKYFEGNKRALKRVERTKSLIQDIGLETERLGIVMGKIGEMKSLADQTEEIMKQVAELAPSPVLKNN